MERKKQDDDNDYDPMADEEYDTTPIDFTNNRNPKKKGNTKKNKIIPKINANKMQIPGKKTKTRIVNKYIYIKPEPLRYQFSPRQLNSLGVPNLQSLRYENLPSIPEPEPLRRLFPVRSRRQVTTQEIGVDPFTPDEVKHNTTLRTITPRSSRPITPVTIVGMLTTTIKEFTNIMDMIKKIILLVVTGDPTVLGAIKKIMVKICTSILQLIIFWLRMFISYPIFSTVTTLFVFYYLLYRGVPIDKAIHMPIHIIFNWILRPLSSAYTKITGSAVIEKTVIDLKFFLDMIGFTVMLPIHLKVPASDVIEYSSEMVYGVSSVMYERGPRTVFYEVKNITTDIYIGAVLISKAIHDGELPDILQQKLYSITENAINKITSVFNITSEQNIEMIASVMSAGILQYMTTLEKQNAQLHEIHAKHSRQFETIFNQLTYIEQEYRNQRNDLLRIENAQSATNAQQLLTYGEYQASSQQQNQLLLGWVENIKDTLNSQSYILEDIKSKETEGIQLLEHIKSTESEQSRLLENIEYASEKEIEKIDGMIDQAKDTSIQLKQVENEVKMLGTKTSNLIKVKQVELGASAISNIASFAPSTTPILKMLADASGVGGLRRIGNAAGRRTTKKRRIRKHKK